MKHFLEDNNISVRCDTEAFGFSIAAGSKVTFTSKQGSFNGLKMRIPPPEFEALMFFSAFEAAASAEFIKKTVNVNKSEFDSMLEVESSDDNHRNFFAVCQNSMAAVTFSISAIESWVNKSIEVYGLNNGNPTELILRRPRKSDRKVLTSKVASDLAIPLRAKLFQLLPQVFKVQPLKGHSTLRSDISHLIDERNIVMHMQSKLSLEDQDLDRASYAIKLFKTNSFRAPELVLKYVKFIYSKSEIPIAPWVNIADAEIVAIKKGLK
ncbi:MULTISPECIES: hypothetical protein [unclassified Alteromonas]|uniref:hypothetical protein n=1 Tax=unclassified Alteromonas TaxID=2614992 RepID=UPI0005094C44|nr:MULTISPECIES: hypothetical protein [unclassified Alteromonas]